MISYRISDDIPPQMKFWNSNALLQFFIKLKHCKHHRFACHPMKCDIINDIKLFRTRYRRIYCRKFLMLSNQMSRYESKCIGIVPKPFKFCLNFAADNSFKFCCFSNKPSRFDILCDHLQTVDKS